MSTNSRSSLRGEQSNTAPQRAKGKTMSEKTQPAFHVGQEVKLKRGAVRLAPADVTNYRSAKIVLFLSDVDGGVRLDRHMGGFRYWNVLDLVPAATRRQKELP
jgi:hypothetical protein